MTTMKQRAAARRNIKKAIAANRRHGGKKSHRSRRSSRGHSSTRSTPAIGSAYQDGKLGAQLLVPVVDSAAQAGHGGVSAFRTQLENHFVNPGNRNNYLMGTAVSVADYIGSKKVGHAAALSRGSVTAWAPEIYAGIKGFSSGGSVLQRAEQGLATTNGYLASDGSFDAARVVPYAAVKYGGAVLRKVLVKAKLSKPISKALGMVGATA